jgi:deoxycytidine triphosphate deaminase
MFFSDQKIQSLVQAGEISIEFFNPQNLKGASYTFTLDSKVRLLKGKNFLDSRVIAEFDEVEIAEDGYELKPNDFAVFYTKERVKLNGKYLCILSTRSTIAHMGLDVIQSSFLAEPDTDNQFSLEITNRGPFPVRLFKGVKIVKGIFCSVT